MNTPTIRPLGDRVLLELIPDEKVTNGGIHLPDNLAKPKPGFMKRARVLAVGAKARRGKQLVAEDVYNANLERGDVVFAVWNCGVPVPMVNLPEGANEQRLIKFEDITAIDLRGTHG